MRAAGEPPMNRVHVVLNDRAGALLDRGAAATRARLVEALGRGGRDVRIVQAHGRALCRSINDAIMSDCDTIVVGGGDGSASYAAARLAGREKILGVLPFGTMNLLARDLGFPADLDEAIGALAEAQPRRVDLATLNGRPFHTLSGIGFYSQMARAREETRGFALGRFVGFGIAALRAVRRSGKLRLTLDVDGRKMEAEAAAAIVTNNRFDVDWRRPALDDGALEVHVAEDSGAFDKLKTLADLLAGTWRENPGIHSFVAREIAIGGIRRRLWVSTDGELHREHTPLRYAIQPRALNVLAVKT
jgi:diacylglycerol kinase family enzyme